MSRGHPGVARALLDREGRANALDAASVETLLASLDAADAAGVALVVVEARGSAFCGGLDLADLDSETDASLLLRLVRVQLLLERVSSLRALTVAVVEGPAVGAGADLAVACDVRLATSGASLRFPGSGFGAVLGTSRLAALTSPAFALEAAVTARRVGANEGADLGLWRVLPDRAAVDDELARLAAASTSLPDGTTARLRAAASGSSGSSAGTGSDALGDLVRSLVGEPGLADRVRAYRSRPRTPSSPPRGVSP